MSIKVRGGGSKYDHLFEEKPEEKTEETLDPQASFKKQMSEHYDGLTRQGSVFEDQVPTTYKPKKPLKPEVSVWDDIKAAPAAALRGFTQGMAVTADLIPTAANALGEYAGDIVTNKPFGTTDLDDVIRPWALSDLADKNLGTTDSYEVGAVSEVTSDVSEAIPMLFSLGAGIARYGASTMMKQGAVNPLFANYTLKFGQSMAIDTAAITIGETAEEITEVVTEEDSGWGTAANIVASVLGGWRLSQSKFMGATDEAVKKAADDQGVVIAGKDSADNSTLGGVTGAAVKAADVMSRPSNLSPTKVAAKTFNAVKEKGVDTGAKVLDNLPFSDRLFREFKENNGSFTQYLKEQRLMDTSNRGYMKKVMESKGDAVKRRYAQNLELAAHLDLRLDTYQLTGLPEFKDFSIAVAKLNPSKSLENIKHNIDMVDDFLKQKNMGFNTESNNMLQAALKKHHGNTEESLEALKASLIKDRDFFIKETTKQMDPARIGEDFLEAYTKYEKNLKQLVGRGFEKAIPAEATIDTKFFNNHVLTELNNLKTEGIIPANLALPKIIKDMMAGTAEQVMESGVRVTPKVTARELHESILQLKKARKNISKADPTHNIKSAQIANVVTSMEDTLAQKLSPKQFAAYNQAKQEWESIIGGKFNAPEVKKFTLKNQFNQLKSNGQELIEELLNTTGASESRVDAINKLLTLSHKDMVKMANRIDDMDVKNIDDLTAAQDVMHLKIKDYIVNDYMTKLLMNPQRPVQEMLEEYMGQHGRMIHSVLNEPMDLNKMAREVQLATKNQQEHIDNEILNALNIGSKGERKIEDWILNDLVKNVNEVKRFDTLINDADKMKAMGMNPTEVRNTIASHIVESFVKRDREGTLTGTTLFNELKKYGDNIEKVIGKERMDHLKTFEKGFGLSDMMKADEVSGEAVDLERHALNKGAMKMLKQSLSTHLMVAHGFVSKTYAYSMRAIQVLGGMKNDGYQKFMTKMMTDPKFFRDTIEMTQDIKSHEDIIRARLVLAHHFGIPTETMNNEEGNQQARSLMESGIVLENSVFKDVVGQPEVSKEAALNTEVTPVVTPEVTPEVTPQEPPTEKPVEKPKEKPKEKTAVTPEALPKVEPSDPTNAISTRKPLSEITDKSIIEAINNMSAEERAKYLEILGRKDGDK